MKSIIIILLITICTGNAKDVYIFIGQSNMMGAAPKENLYSKNRQMNGVYGFNGSGYSFNPDPALSSSNNVYHINSGSYALNWHGPVPTAMQVIREFTSTTPYFLKFTYDGSPLHPSLTVPGYIDWNWTEQLYTNFINTCSTALSPGDVVKAVFFMQGETDAIELTTSNSTQYAIYLAQLRNRIANDLNCNNFIVGRIKDTYNQSKNIRTAQETQMWVNTDDLQLRVDNIHYSTEGLIKLGVRFACKYLGLKEFNSNKGTVIFNPSTGHWYRLNNTGYWQRVIFGHGLGSSNQWVIDVNNDSFDDAVVYFPSNGSWYVCTGNEDGTFNGYALWLSGHGVGSSDQDLKDCDLDNKPDALVYFDYAGQYYVAPNTGAAFGSYYQWLNLNVLQGAELLPLIKD